jgi:hypothetical protein
MVVLLLKVPLEENFQAPVGLLADGYTQSTPGRQDSALDSFLMDNNPNRGSPQKKPNNKKVAIHLIFDDPIFLFQKKIVKIGGSKMKINKINDPGPIF